MQGTHLLTVYVPQQGLVQVQAEVDHKENEIVVAPLTVGWAGHNIAILNNIAVGLCLRNNLRNLAQARRQSYAQPREALALIVAVQ
jgi:hypothetical protein